MCIDYETKGIWYTYKSLHFEYELLLMLQDTRLNVPGHLLLSFIGGRARCARISGVLHQKGISHPICCSTQPNGLVATNAQYRQDGKVAAAATRPTAVHLFRVKNNPGRFAWPAAYLLRC